MRADLHLHSDYSDGCCPPAEIFSRAVAKGLGILSITDHDTVAHLSPARQQAARTGILFIPGVEFSASRGERDVHLLGYGVDENEPALLEYLEQVRRRRLERAYQILDLLRMQGIKIPDREIEKDALEGGSRWPAGSGTTRPLPRRRSSGRAWSSIRAARSPRRSSPCGDTSCTPWAERKVGNE